MAREKIICLGVSPEKLNNLTVVSLQSLDIGTFQENYAKATRVNPIIGNTVNEDALSYTIAGLNVYRIISELEQSHKICMSLEKTPSLIKPYLTNIRAESWLTKEVGIKSLEYISAVLNKDCEELVSVMIKGSILELAPSVALIRIK